MEPRIEDVETLLDRNRKSVHLSRWLEDEVWQSLRASLSAVNATHEMLQRGEKDLKRFRRSVAKAK